jgi:hypothetical protein
VGVTVPYEDLFEILSSASKEVELCQVNRNLWNPMVWHKNISNNYRVKRVNVKQFELPLQWKYSVSIWNYFRGSKCQKVQIVGFCQSKTYNLIPQKSCKFKKLCLSCPCVLSWNIIIKIRKDAAQFFCDFICHDNRKCCTNLFADGHSVTYAFHK